jgi:hypothetical protein
LQRTGQSAPTLHEMEEVLYPFFTQLRPFVDAAAAK